MNTPIAQHLLPSGVTLSLYHGDLTEEHVDAVVNAANEHLAHGGGVAGAIVRKGGAGIQRESDEWVRAHGPVRTGTAAITGAGKLPAKFVIHAVGPVWSGNPERDDALLRGAVTSALTLAHERGLASIALPAISTGIFGFPKDRGAAVITQAILDFCEAKPDSTLRDIRITLIDTPTVEVFKAEFDRRWR
ncbi:MAG: macro domain-containing protein [Chloroflexi bacterium]|nr:macro domain-containing protein [Chloroflexota bacterium]